ncbi:MAG TPA: diacylglycerol kinase family protein [Kineosporiaceae bacterium]|nr:diacylglycerol kinase family protein [Kineosporiaceae bacterium]
MTARDGAPRAVAGTPSTSTARHRWLARGALLAAVAAVVVPLATVGVRGGIGVVLIGVAGLAVQLVAVWWFLTHRGPLRWLSGALAVLTPLAVVAIYARTDLLWVVLATLVLWGLSLAAAGAALAPGRMASRPAEAETPPPRRPFLIMNPKSGGGKVARFDLVRKARQLGADVVLLGEEETDVLALARRAVADGADLLGVAGGDGTQALVAGVAAAHGLPFMVISAGTRNHFALDLGLDREDPARCLDALSDGVEVRVDLGTIDGRTFVNNASFGVYAAVVQSPAYRDDKVRTTLDLLPDLLNRNRGTVLTVEADGVRVSGPQAVLVSNNPYGGKDPAGLGRRFRLDGGALGLMTITVDAAADAAALARGLNARSIWRTTCREAVVDAGTPTVQVGVDGEALVLPTPVRCTIRPGALRVRVPRARPGVPSEHPAFDWRGLLDLALSTGHRPRP